MSVPKLRFSGFSDGWVKTTIGEIGSFYYGKSAPKWSIAEDAETPCVRYGELYTRFNGTVDQIHSYTNIERKNLKFSKGGEILVPRVGEDPNDFSKCSMLPFEGVAIGEMISVFNTDEDSQFYTYYFRTKTRPFAKMVAGSSPANLYFENLKPLTIFRPSLPEQKKIAGFLGVVDAKIAALRARVAGLTRYKRGLMQALFSQTLRFTNPDGSPFPDWEEKRLGDVAEIIGGGTPDTDKVEFWNGEIVWFTPSEIKKKYLTTSTRKISASGLSSSSAKMLPVGALILSTRATVGDVGIATMPCSTNQGFQSLVMKGRNYNEFWYYWLNNNKKAVLRRSAGSTFLEIGKSEVQKLPVQCPHPDEQAKIADALSAMDAKIAAVTQQLDHMQRFKKGLLQQMFV